jgi:Uma2 family endonuclease
MAKTEIKFTYQDYLQMPEDKRCELIEGEFHTVPSPSTSHQTLVKRLFTAIDDHVVALGLGDVLFAPLDVVLSDENVVQPDILFVSKGRSHIITEKNVQGAPDLVIEITSPATVQRDKGIKRKLYARFGVREYWLVDSENKTIDVMILAKSGFETAKAYKAGETLTSPLLKGLSIDLSEVF